MHNIDTSNAGPGGTFVGKGQIEGALATALSAPWFNDIQFNISKSITNEGVDLVKGDYNQLSQVMQSIAGKKRNLNYNPAFYIKQKWRGSQGIATPISGSAKMQPTGWVVGGSINTSDTLIINSSPAGLSIKGTANSTGQTISISQSHSRTDDSAYGNDNFTATGETKYFTSSVKYKKVSGIDFTIKSYIGTLLAGETPIKEVEGNSSTASVGMAYKQTSINTKDLVTTPISSCGFEIALASAGAFEILIKNCDFTEGLSLPDFQVYGDYIADKAFAIAEYGDEVLSGSYSGILAAAGAIDDSGEIRSVLTIPTKHVFADDVVTISNENLVVFDAISGGNPSPATTISSFEVKTYDGYARIEIYFTFASPQTTVQFALVSFDWTYTKA